MNFLKLIIILGSLIYLLQAGAYLPAFVPVCTGLPIDKCNNWDGCSNITCAGVYNMSLFNCSTYSNATSCQQMGCQWNGCTGTAIGLNCSKFFSDQTSCNSANIRNCTWNPTLNKCLGIFTPECPDLNTISNCNLGSGCYWSNGNCTGKFVAYKSCDKLGSPYCGLNPGCSTNCSGTPGMICQSIRNELLCGAYSGCYWQNGMCTGQWVSGAAVSCNMFPVNVCDSIPGCTKIQACSNYPCNATKSMEICMNTQGCIWHRGTCVWKFTGLIQWTYISLILLIITIGLFQDIKPIIKDTSSFYTRHFKQKERQFSKYFQQFF